MHDVGSHNFKLDMVSFKVRFVCNFSIFGMNPKQIKKYLKKRSKINIGQVMVNPPPMIRFFLPLI